MACTNIHRLRETLSRTKKLFKLLSDYLAGVEQFKPISRLLVGGGGGVEEEEWEDGALDYITPEVAAERFVTYWLKADNKAVNSSGTSVRIVRGGGEPAREASVNADSAMEEMFVAPDY